MRGRLTHTRTYKGVRWREVVAATAHKLGLLRRKQLFSIG